MIINKLKNRVIIYSSKLIFCLRAGYYYVKNRGKPKLFVFTDSRGYEVTTLWNKRNPFSSYVGNVIKEFSVEYHICEYASTTIIDFLYEYNKQVKKGKSYDFVIMHAGLVDFSPRPKSMAINILKNKYHKIKSLNWDFSLFEQNVNNPVSTEIYNNEQLSNLYTQDFLEHEIIPLLEKIPNLIYIGCNQILSDWRGNYWQDRPRDINKVLMSYNMAMLTCLKDKYTINIAEWGENEIKNYTVDNIHLNQRGYNIITIELGKILRNKK